MSIKYFTGNNVFSANRVPAANSSASWSSIATTTFGKPENPLSTSHEGGFSPRQRAATDTHYRRILDKMIASSSNAMVFVQGSNQKAIENPGGSGNKTRSVRLRGKYELGKLWKYRKTLKKLLDTGVDGAGAASAANKGIRNMFTKKGAGETTRSPGWTPANHYAMYPIHKTKA